MVEHKLRQLLFFGILTPLVSFMVWFELTDYWDSALMNYSLMLIFLAGNILWWTYWWINSRRKPSVIFTVNGLLLYAMFLNYAVMFVARWFFVYHRHCYEKAILESDLWAYRSAPQELIILWLFCWITSRFFGEPEHDEDKGGCNDAA